MPLIQKTNYIDAGDTGERLVAILVLINDNFERYLDHLRVPSRSTERLADSAASLFIGTPESELDAAIREHRELYGHEAHDATD